MAMPFRDMDHSGREEKVCERAVIPSTFMWGALGTSLT